MEGLHHCHEIGFAHRDLKPENLMLDGDFNLKIVDFGFAAALKGVGGMGKMKTYCGTEEYMAPEIM